MLAESTNSFIQLQACAQALSRSVYGIGGNPKPDFILFPSTDPAFETLASVTLFLGVDCDSASFEIETN